MAHLLIFLSASELKSVKNFYNRADGLVDVCRKRLDLLCQKANESAQARNPSPETRQIGISMAQLFSVCMLLDHALGSSSKGFLASSKRTVKPNIDAIAAVRAAEKFVKQHTQDSVSGHATDLENEDRILALDCCPETGKARG